MIGIVNIWVALAAVGFALLARIIHCWQSGVNGTKLWEDMRTTLARAMLYVNVLGMALVLTIYYPSAIAVTHYLVWTIAIVEFGAGLEMSGISIPKGWKKVLTKAAQTYDQSQPPSSAGG